MANITDAAIQSGHVLPCPFCGGPGQWVGSADGDYVECGACLARMPPHDDDVPNEVQRWNTRIASPPHPIGHGVDAAIATIQAHAARLRVPAITITADNLTSTGSAGHGEREAIARIIDPDAFAIYPFDPDQSEDFIEAVEQAAEEALAKADAILALAPTGSAEPEIPADVRAKITAGDARYASRRFISALDKHSAPETVTYNPVYDTTYVGADPTRGFVYSLAKPAASQSGGDALREAAATFAWHDIPISAEVPDDAHFFSDALTGISITVGQIRALRAALSHPTTTAADKAGDGAK